MRKGLKGTNYVVNPVCPFFNTTRILIQMRSKKTCLTSLRICIRFILMNSNLNWGFNKIRTLQNVQMIIFETTHSGMIKEIYRHKKKHPLLFVSKLVKCNDLKIKTLFYFFMKALIDTLQLKWFLVCLFIRFLDFFI